MLELYSKDIFKDVCYEVPIVALFILLTTWKKPKSLTKSKFVT